MCGNSDRLVDNDEVIVVVHDAEVGDRERDDDGCLPGLPFDLEPGIGTQPVRFAQRHAVETNPARLRDLGGETARKSQKLRQAGVDSLPGQAVRDG